jgi:hypothetical protein
LHQVAEALRIARETKRHWVEINIEIDSAFSADDHDDIHRIFDLIRPYYLERAPARLIPAEHGVGDVTVADTTRRLHACLRRIRPGVFGYQEEAVEYFILRIPDEREVRMTDEEMTNGGGPHVDTQETIWL